MKVFFKKINVPKIVECVLVRSILEHVPDFAERFFFLKKGFHDFGTRSIPFYFMIIFHWHYIENQSSPEKSDRDHRRQALPIISYPGYF
jgi:hypothetical protein